MKNKKNLFGRILILIIIFSVCNIQNVSAGLVNPDYTETTTNVWVDFETYFLEDCLNTPTYYGTTQRITCDQKVCVKK